jgi:tripartite-type tricarboxylate transporter receptor subunit TctC
MNGAGNATVSSTMLVVDNAVPAKSVKELVALAKAQPGGLTFASGGSGSTPDLAAELFKSMAGLDVRLIPYKGVVAAIPDLIKSELPRWAKVIREAGIKPD